MALVPGPPDPLPPDPSPCSDTGFVLGMLGQEDEDPSTQAPRQVLRISYPLPTSHEIKRRLPLGRKVMTNLDSIFKSRDITLPTKVRLVKAMVFPVVMYGCESWTVKKAKRQRIDAFELWCWRRLLRVPWTARRHNQSIQISPGVLWKDWC